MSEPHRVVVAGAGVAGLEVTLALRELAADRVDIEVVAPERQFTYRPLAVAEPFAAGEAVRFDLADLVGGTGARLRTDRITAIHADRHVVTTAGGKELPYGSLVVTCGGRPTTVLVGALTFRGTEDAGEFSALLAALEDGDARSVAFTLPGGSAWPIPLYELALLTGAHSAARGLSPRLVLVTSEAEPLALFGRAASEAARAILAERGIDLVTGTHAVAVKPGALVVGAGRRIDADRVVTVPRLLGPALPGLPCDAEGFIPTDPHGSVFGLDGVYAAGDATTFPVKQGGIATQQADAVAQVIAARAGVAVSPQPFRPVLRGLLLTGGRARFLRSEMTSGHGDSSEAALEALWWPPSKISGRYLGPYLALRAGDSLTRPPTDDAIEVDVVLDVEPG